MYIKVGDGCCRRAKRRRAEAEGLEEAAAMGGYETGGYGGYYSAGPSSFFTGACAHLYALHEAGIQTSTQCKLYS
jgi:hypothetical protein